MRPFMWVWTLAILVACSGEGASEGGIETEGRSIISAGDRGVIALDRDRGEVALFDQELQRIGAVSVGRDPMRVVRVGDEVYVTVRGTREVVKLRASADHFFLTEEARLEIGAEPYGLAASPDGSKIYAAASLSGEVVEIDLGRFAISRRWTIAGEPRYLAIHPEGSTLFVGSALGGTVNVVDLKSGDVAPVALRELLDPTRTDGHVMPKRVSGDLAVSPDGRWLVVPLTYGSLGISAMIGGPIYYPQGGVATPVVGHVELDGEGKPDPVDAPMVVLNTIGVNYATSVSFDTANDQMLLSIEAQDSVLVLSSDPSQHYKAGVLQMALIEAPKAPTGVAIHGDRAFVLGLVSRVVREFQPSTAAVGNSVDRPHEVHHSESLLADSPFDEEVQLGRALFYSARDERVTGGSASCAGCHIEGRCDGWTWEIDGKKRQTPSLTERVSARAPLRWAGDRTDVVHDAMETSKRMGARFGEGLSLEDAQAVAAFIDTIPQVDLPLRGANDPAAQRGRLIFNREDVGCGSCHSGVLLTDKAMYNISGEALKTPALLGVASTPPYLHDGSVPTLEALVNEYSAARRMGNTSMLSEQERNDLIAYLKSL